MVEITTHLFTHNALRQIPNTTFSGIAAANSAPANAVIINSSITALDVVGNPTSDTYT